MVFAALRLWLLPSLAPPVIPHVSLFAATGRRASVWWDAGASGPRSPSLRAQTVDPPCRSPHPENLGLGTAKPALLRAGLAALVTKRFHAELGQVNMYHRFLSAAAGKDLGAAGITFRHIPHNGGGGQCGPSALMLPRCLR